MRPILTPEQFNKLLDDEVRKVALYYQLQTHYEPREYINVRGGDNASPSSYIIDVKPFDDDLLVMMRRTGAQYAVTDDAPEPLAIFVVQAAYGIKVDEDPNTLQRVISIYGVTNDGRTNIAILPAQNDEDDRLYALPSDVFHYNGPGDSHHVEVLPFLEFFVSHDRLKSQMTTRADV